MAETGRTRFQPAGDEPMVTSCDRMVTVKCLRLAMADRPISRVTLDLGPGRGAPGTWASLTAREARELARRLLAQAALADGGAPTAAGPLPSVPPSPQPPPGAPAV